MNKNEFDNTEWFKDKVIKYGNEEYQLKGVDFSVGSLMLKREGTSIFWVHYKYCELINHSKQ